MFDLIIGVCFFIFSAFFTFINITGGEFYKAVTYILEFDFTSFYTLLINNVQLNFTYESFFDVLPIWLIFFGSWLATFYYLFKGVKKFKRDTLTKNKGEICFGRICNFVFYGVEVLVYIPSTKETKIIRETVDSDPLKSYRLGTYVKLKYYDGDINFERAIYSSELPLEALNVLTTSDLLPKCLR